MYWKIPSVFCTLLMIAFSFFPFLTACAPTNAEKPPVSEYLSQIYLAKGQGFSAQISFSKREQPYTPNGVCGELCPILEVLLTAPDNTPTYFIKVQNESQTWVGDVSFNDVFQHFTFSCSAEQPNANKLFLTVHLDQPNGKEVASLTALPVQPNPLPASVLISPLLSRLKSPFDGEIYLRLLHTPTLCYYAELIDKQGKREGIILDEAGNPQGELSIFK